VICRFDDNKPVPEAVHINQIFKRKIYIDCSFKNCTLCYEYGPEKKLISIQGRKKTASVKEYELTELRNNQSVDFRLLILFGEGEHQQKIEITHVYTQFSMIRPLQWQFYSPTSSIKVKKHMGQYLTFSTVMDTDTTYQGVLINSQNGKECIQFNLDSKRKDQEIRIGNDPLNGCYYLEIFRIKKMMGMGSKERDLLYKSDTLHLIHGRILSADSLVNTTLKVNYTFIPDYRHSNGRKPERVKINNFYLSITEYDGNTYLADGYFLTHDKKIFQTFNNPYTLSQVRFQKQKVHFTISDNKGRDLSISCYGDVNNLNQFSPYRLSELSATILPGEL
jgi:hypothetical protein